MKKILIMSVVAGIVSTATYADPLPCGDGLLAVVSGIFGLNCSAAGRTSDGPLGPPVQQQMDRSVAYEAAGSEKDRQTRPPVPAGGERDRQPMPPTQYSQGSESSPMPPTWQRGDRSKGDKQPLPPQS